MPDRYGRLRLAFAVDILARVILAPLLVGQGLWCRKTARGLPDPPGQREGMAGTGTPLRVLIVGDSSAVGVGCTHQRQTLSGQMENHIAGQRQLIWRNLSRTGARTEDVLEWINHIPQEPYDVAVTCLGVNDVTGRVSLRRWLRMQQALITRLRDEFGARHIYLSGIPPIHQFPLLPNPLRWVLGRQAQRFNAALVARFGNQEGLHVGGLDMQLSPEVMSVDGFHPGPIVYAEWARRVLLFFHREGLIDEGPDSN